ncbi:FtsX-like permease family protein [Massilia sp. MB5]|uniref:ABC transporter permease n=1 Tax=Massilia sp. MB5 TaxID=2919578 RepID=UPI001F0FB925|nr:FtsX-like permease family protein [Massilia sp. MB5]UMR32291.1 FtsX-like permease family protein [Massilia sp. MB5]
MEIRPIFSALMRNKTGPLLVAIQVALSLAILANALHIVNVRQAVSARPSGIAAESDVLNLFAYSLKAGGHEEQLALQQAQTAALRAVPGVVSVARINQYPMSQSGNYSSITTSRSQLKKVAVTSLYMSGDSLIKTWGLKLVEGRDFTPADVWNVDETASKDYPDIIIITRALGRKLWPDASSYAGKVFYFGKGETARAVTVVGVVDSLQTPNAQVGPEGEFSSITPVRNTGWATSRYTIRAEPGQIERVTKDAEEALRKLENQQVVIESTTMDEHRADRYRADRALAWMLIAVSVLLLLVTASGVVGMASLWVTQRRKQIGVRRALGARRIDILRYFVTENVMITSVGVASGLLGALALNHLLVSKFEMERLPGAYLLAGAGLFWLLGVAAVYGPAWRAASISPALATRSA